MPITEHTINDALAAQLRETRRAWRATEIVSSENTVMLRGSTGRPDILVIEPNVSPVVIETELLPAVTVEHEAIARLGQHLRATGRQILSSIAVRLPMTLASRSGAALARAIADATDLEMAMYTGNDPQACQRIPPSGWIRGSVADLSVLTQSASVPPGIVETAVTQLITGVSEAAGLLEEMAQTNPGAIHRISEELKQEDGQQTRRMAATILANAFVFHGNLAGGPGALANIATIDELRTAAGNLTKTRILGEWRRILAINYWPIFDIARRILEVVPAAHSGALLDSMARTADVLLQSRLMRSHDLTGAVFQQLIADRRFLAAFYTTPASAALLVGLAITPERPLNGDEWADADRVTALRVADFACGTGTLVSTAYQRIGQLHELAGGDSEAIHPDMMATALVGCDVLPAAAHLTASMLAGAHPTTQYTRSSILTVAYGKQPNGDVALGSLDLLDPQGQLEVLAITARAAEGMGEAERHTWFELPHASFDVVLMNPPFTRATGHHEINNVGVPNPMFAAFSSTDEEQRLMSAATRRLTANTSAHGNAGEASIFLALAHRKLKANGVLGLVMPLSLLSGDAWEDSRLLLKDSYSDLIVISISGQSGRELSFSADTDMAECLIIARKNQQGSTRAFFLILAERPASTLFGNACSTQLRQLIETGNIRRLEDGPMGGTALYFGDHQIGQVLDAPLPESGSWNLARISDLSLAQTAYQLANHHRLWLPTMVQGDAVDIAIATVDSIGSIGPGHRDISGEGTNGALRGPFTIAPLGENTAPTYPVLWAHDADRERTMEFPADSEGRPRRGRTRADQRAIDERVASIFATASHCHFNLDFRYNSQSTGMQFTARAAIGGRAWPSITLANADEEKALVLWGNTSLGILLHWWYANKTQAGRGSMLRSKLSTYPVLDVTRLTQSQLRRAVRVFNEMRDRGMTTIDEIDSDAVRHLLDQRFGMEVLNLPSDLFATDGPFDLLRRKMALEPSIRG